jgi:hypothetical protein
LSGQFVNVFSGGIVTVQSGQLSGQNLDLTSGQSWVAGAGSISSGSLFIASGTPVSVGSLSSGILSGQYLDANVAKWLQSTPLPLVGGGQVQSTDAIRAGVSQGVPNVNSIQLDAGASSNDDVYTGLMITLPTIATPQCRLIVRYVGATRTATVFPPFTIAPPPASIFVVDAHSYGNVYINNDKSGYALSASGLDPIQVESGFNMRQAVALVFAAECGMVSGAGTTLFNIGNMSGQSRIISIVDQSGNRSAPLVLTPLP